MEKLTKTVADAHTVRARLGDGGESDVIDPDDIDRLRESAKRLAAWRRLITDTVESVTVAPAMTAEGAPVASGTLAGSTSEEQVPRRVQGKWSAGKPLAGERGAGSGDLGSRAGKCWAGTDGL